MRSEKLFGISAIFNSPDDIVNAAKKISDAGYTKYDVYTPYPVHGLDKAMKLKPSKLGYLTLIFGLSGAAFAMMFMFWAMSIEYPMIIGGKPFFALPAFVPVTFELTVLLATLATVIGMITFFFNYPYNNHPLHSTDFMKKVSLDKYGVCIEAEDPLFDSFKVKELFSGMSGNFITEEYFPVEEKHTVLEPKFILLLFLIFIVTSAGIYIVLNKVTFMVPFDWMMKQERINAQSPGKFFKDEFGMRTPVEGTISRGHIPYEFTSLEQPAEPLSNPIPPSKQIFALGKKKFLTFCSPCHGNFGDGDSRLGDQFPKPPSLHSSKAREWKDGNIYHVIMMGQNVMPSYASQMTEPERWAVVHYVRVLQKAKNPTDEEINIVKSGSVPILKEDTTNAK